MSYVVTNLLWQWLSYVPYMNVLVPCAPLVAGSSCYAGFLGCLQLHLFLPQTQVVASRETQVTLGGSMEFWWILTT